MADNADAQLPQAAGDDTQVNALSSSQEPGSLGDDATVLTSSPALVAQEFPQGLSPRELSLALKGQLLDHFLLQEFVGGGGMGAVFKALDTTLDRIVAVKVVASQSISSEDLQRRFLIEAQSTARLDHPNIARIHFVGRDRGLPYIVFEYIDGVNLRDLVVNHGPIPIGDALSFSCQIAHALAHAWEKKVVHRDIKPSNILITREGQAKLVDMGLARFHQVDAAENDLTSTGVTLGTFDYISPEQARDPREADTRSDIYSLGCTLFYMLAGRAPFAQGTAVQKLLMHQDQSPPNLSELRPGIPDAVTKLVHQMLAKSPDRRPQTPSELVGAFHDIFQSLGLQPPQSLPPLPRIRQIPIVTAWQSHLPWAIPLATLLAIGGGWLLRGFGPAESIEFPPLKRPIAIIADPIARAEVPETISPIVHSSSAEDAFEGSGQTYPAAIEEKSRSISFGEILDSVPLAENKTAVAAPLLEFPEDDLALPADTSSVPEKRFDINDFLPIE